MNNHWMRELGFKRSQEKNISELDVLRIARLLMAEESVLMPLKWRLIKSGESVLSYKYQST